MVHWSPFEWFTGPLFHWTMILGGMVVNFIAKTWEEKYFTSCNKHTTYKSQNTRVLGFKGNTSYDVFYCYNVYLYNIHRFHSLYHNKLSHRTHTKTQSFCFFSDEQCKTKKWLLSFDTGDEILSGSTGIMKTPWKFADPINQPGFHHQLSKGLFHKPCSKHPGTWTNQDFNGSCYVRLLLTLLIYIYIYHVSIEKPLVV